MTSKHTRKKKFATASNLEMSKKIVIKVKSGRNRTTVFLLGSKSALVAQWFTGTGFRAAGDRNKAEL